MSNKKIVVHNCIGCPLSHIFKVDNYGSKKSMLWCKITKVTIPEEVVNTNSIWKECQLKDNDND
jgi:hypothetical protein